MSDREEALEAENKRLRAALRWYAKRDRYETSGAMIVDQYGGDIILLRSDLMDDNGQRARDALKRPRTR